MTLQLPIADPGYRSTVQLPWRIGPSAIATVSAYCKLVSNPLVAMPNLGIRPGDTERMPGQIYGSTRSRC